MQWCEQDRRCHRLLLTDLLIAPMQLCTKVPLLLNNILQHTVDPLDKLQLSACLEALEKSLSKCNHYDTCGISSLLRSVNPVLIPFTLLLVLFIMHASLHHCLHLRSHHLSLPQPFTADLKLVCSVQKTTNPFIRSLSGSFWTVFIDLEPLPDQISTGVFVFFFKYVFFCFWLRVL